MWTGALGTRSVYHDAGLRSSLRPLVIGLLRYWVTIDDHAAARDWIAGTIAAISPGRGHEEGISPFASTSLPPLSHDG